MTAGSWGRRACCGCVDPGILFPGPIGAQPETDPAGTLVIRDDLLASGPKLRHDAAATRAALLRAWREARHQPRAQVAQ